MEQMKPPIASSATPTAWWCFTCNCFSNKYDCLYVWGWGRRSVRSWWLQRLLWDWLTVMWFGKNVMGALNTWRRAVQYLGSTPVAMCKHMGWFLVLPLVTDAYSFVCVRMMVTRLCLPMLTACLLVLTQSWLDLLCICHKKLWAGLRSLTLKLNQYYEANLQPYLCTNLKGPPLLLLSQTL